MKEKLNDLLIDGIENLVELIASYVENTSYHRSKQSFNLPGFTEPAYTANAKDGMRWSEPMRPSEIAENIRREFGGDKVREFLDGNEVQT